MDARFEQVRPLVPPPRSAPRRHWRAIAVAAVLLLLAAGVALAVFFALNGRDAGLKPDPNVQVGSIAGSMDHHGIVSEGELSFSINATPVFADGTAPGNMRIENLKDAKNRFTVAIVRNDTGEQVYQSGAVDPGRYIENAPLSIDLPAGTYPCTAVFSTYRLKDDTPIGKANVVITLTVQR